MWRECRGKTEMMSIPTNIQGEKVAGEISKQEYLTHIHHRSDQSGSLQHKLQVGAIHNELLLQIIILFIHSTNIQGGPTPCARHSQSLPSSMVYIKCFLDVNKTRK